MNLQHSTLERDLGVLIDEPLSFPQHVHKMSCWSSMQTVSVNCITVQYCITSVGKDHLWSDL